MTTLSEMMARPRGVVAGVTPEAAASAIETGDVDLIIDLREPAEPAELHVAGATCIPRGLLELRTDPASPSADPELACRHSARILVYCTRGPGARSLLAGETLVAMGFDRVETLTGRLAAWSEASLPVEGSAVAQRGRAR